MYYTIPRLARYEFEHIADARKRAVSHLTLSDKHDIVHIYEVRRGLQGMVFPMMMNGKRRFMYRSSAGVDYIINKDGTLKR